MALEKGSIQNLLGGISQQAVALRLPTQSDDEVNTWPVIVDGLVRRPPTEHVFTLLSQVPTTAFTHLINRDEVERYVVTIANNVVTVTDLQGNARTVNYPNGNAYLNVPAGTESTNLAAVTIADYTFIVNKTIATAMLSTTAPARLPEALVNVIQGNYGRTYTVTVNGTQVASQQTNSGGVATDTATIDTTWIASHLNTQIAAALTVGAGWNIVTNANTVWIQNAAGIDFTVSCVDGWSGLAMKVVKGETQFFTNLPNVAPEGFVAGIRGDTSQAEQVYYVKFSATGSLGQPVIGSWTECPAPGVKTSFDPATMPQILVRNGDGSFTLKNASWNPRVAGDLNTIPQPSFVGSTINGVTFFGDRLGFLTDDNAVLSQVGDFFNFWRSSAIVLLDTDPIDINSASPNVAVLRAAIPYQNGLSIFADQNQFSFGAQNVLSPKTAQMPQVSAYESLCRYVAPVSITRRVLFAFDRNAYVGVKEWYYDVYYHVASAEEVTSHVPILIPAGATKMAVSSTEDCLVVTSVGDRSSLWVYKFLWEGQDKVQSAWTRWNFVGGSILSAFIINSTLYLLINRGGQTLLEKMRLSPGLTDSGGPVTYLDRRVGSDVLTAPTYSIATDLTTYVLPYTPPSDGTFTAVTRFNAYSPQYQNMAVAGVAGNVVTLQGDTRNLLLWFGVPFTTARTFSEIFVRSQDGKNVIQEGQLQLLKLDVTYQDSAYFRVEVTPSGNSTSSYEFVGWRIGDTIPDIDAPPSMFDGVFSFPVLANSSNVTIRLVNDSFLPSKFIRAEWKGNFVPKTRK